MMAHVIARENVLTLDEADRMARTLAERMRAEAGADTVEHVHALGAWEKRVLNERGRILARVVVLSWVGGFSICAAWEAPSLLEQLRSALAHGRRLLLRH